MQIKDRITLANWKNASLSEVENVPAIGLVGNERFTPRAKRTFRLMHEWGAERFSSRAQDRFYALHGRAAYLRRIARVQRLAGVIFGTERRVTK